ncbi:MAG TPA: enoyl-CoA hydratase-related protein [Rhizobiaceae bacterium]|nr:enoyl-CoA hydratase-related protein [Rhizobiaceae bacterium]
MRIQVTMQNETLIADSDGGVVTLTFNRPQKKNAITYAMWLELATRVSTAASDPSTRVVVIRGQGNDFSAGADIGEFASLRSGGGDARAYEAANSAAFAAIRRAAVPVVAAIRGICFGGGFGIAAACDLRLATPDAQFAVPAARLGLAYPHDAMSDIVEALGPQAARYLAFTAARIDAAAALGAGFLLEIVTPDRFDERIAEVAQSIAGNAPLSVRASKASIRAALSGSAADVEHARMLGDATFDSHDYAEGRRAFAEKRRPLFEGR